MSTQIIDGHVVEIKEVTSRYSEDDIDREIEMINNEMDMHQNEIDRLNKDLKIWQDRKALLNKK